MPDNFLRAEARKFKEASKHGLRIHRRSFRHIRALFAQINGETPPKPERRTPVKRVAG